MFYLHFYFIYLLWLHCVPCRILFSWPGIEPGPQRWKCRVLTTGQPGNSLFELFFFKKIFVSVLNSPSAVLLCLLISLSANYIICVNLCQFWLTDFFFSLHGFIFLLLCMPANLWLVARHCDISCLVLDIFVCTLELGFGTELRYLEIVWSFWFCF